MIGKQPLVYRTRVDQAPINKLSGDRGVSFLLASPAVGFAKNIDLHLNELKPGSGPGPTHFHEHAENIYWVLDGKIEVAIGDDVHHLSPGDVLVIPPGVIHATSNPYDRLCRFIEIYAPPGPDFHVVVASDEAHE